MLADTDGVVERLDAGLKSDLLICAPEINTGELAKRIEAIGLPVPPVLQPTAARTPSACQDIHRDPLSWLGNEDNSIRLGQRIADMERLLILQTLTHCGGNRSWAADILGISSRTLRNKLQQYSDDKNGKAATGFRHDGRSERPASLAPAS